MPRRQDDLEYHNHFAMVAFIDRDVREGVQRMLDDADWPRYMVKDGNLRGSTCLHLLVGAPVPTERQSGYEPNEWIEWVRPLFQQVGSSQQEPSASFLRRLGEVFCGRRVF